MSDVAYACAMLKLPVDLVDLYYTEDDMMILWLHRLTRRVADARRREAEKAKK